MFKLFGALAASIVISITGCNSFNEKKSPFSFVATDQGVQLHEKGHPVFFYQKEPKSSTGEYICSNYLHPVYSLTGDTITQEFPADHPYHRGIFWTWHQLYAGNKSIGDGWINEGIFQDVVNITTGTAKDMARLEMVVMWRSAYLGGDPFMRENTAIIVHKQANKIRKIDFEITLNALVDSLEIGGSDDEKGYGGFCTRIKLPDNLIFTAENGRVEPQVLQIAAGPWMDFSASFGEGSVVSGLAILCHPSVPSYPEPWILRQKTSMQNVVFPGQKRIGIPKDRPVILRYRVIIHDGSAESIDLPALQAEYSRM